MVDFTFPPDANDPQSFSVFPSPLFVFNWAEADRWQGPLRSTVEKKQKIDAGISRTNAGGWHSDVDLPSWEGPAIGQLISFIALCADQAIAKLNDVGPDWRAGPWRTQAWANVNPPGGAHNRVHDHVQMNWHLSGCYYITTAKPATGTSPKGRLMLSNQWNGLTLPDSEPQELAFIPREGQLILFPSWQHHRVEAHDGSEDRVTIAFNMHARELQRSRFWTHRKGMIEKRFPAIVGLLRTMRGARGHDADGMPWGFDIQ